MGICFLRITNVQRHSKFYGPNDTFYSEILKNANHV